jgi:hypothetical protein
VTGANSVATHAQHQEESNYFAVSHPTGHCRTLAHDGKRASVPSRLELDREGTMAVDHQNPVIHFTPNQSYTLLEGLAVWIVNTGRINNYGFVNDQDYTS